MKNFILSLLLILPISSFSQEENVDSTLLKAFDFWVGEWEVHWLNADSSYTYGTNSIEKIMDGKVIQESFNDPNSGFKGRSISVFSPQDSTWHQAWVDNSGGYFDFYGIVDEDIRMFQTQALERNGKILIQRMVFKEITKEAFIWDWESSQDNGETWNLVWQIFYERKENAE